MYKLKFIISIIISVLLCQNSYSFYQYIFLEDVIESSYLNDLPLEGRENLEKIIMVPNGIFNEQEAGEIIKRIDHLPVSLLEKIRSERIYIKLFTGLLTDHPTTRYLRGVTPRGYANSETTWDDVPGIGGGKTVLVKIGASYKGKGHSSTNLELHELAHSIDRQVFNHIRENPQFQKIWREEVWSLFGNEAYFQLFPEEYFAESFAMFYANKETNLFLMEKAPKTYSLIEDLK